MCAFLAKAAEVVIPGCLVAALISAFLQLESLRCLQEKAAETPSSSATVSETDFPQVHKYKESEYTALI